MEKDITASIEEHFGSITDPRIERTKLHKLIDILAIAICGAICNCDSWEDVEEFGTAKQEWLETFLELPNGIPSHDTFNRVFARLDPMEFRTCFIGWVSVASELIGGQVIAMDGKVLRRSHDRGIGKGAIDMVSACWQAGWKTICSRRFLACLNSQFRCVCPVRSSDFSRFLIK